MRDLAPLVDKFTVVIPWSYREERWANLCYVMERWELLGLSVLLGAVMPDEPWCKGKAIADAMKIVETEFVIVTDADVWAPGILDSMDHCWATGQWTIEQRLYRLDGPATWKVRRGELAFEDVRPAHLEGKPYRQRNAGAPSVFRTETVLDVPMDPRFVGWGGEDLAWSDALHALAGGARRMAGPVYHLWHPHDGTPHRRPEGANAALYDRYQRARYLPGEMRAIINEFKETTT